MPFVTVPPILAAPAPGITTEAANEGNVLPTPCDISAIAPLQYVQ